MMSKTYHYVKQIHLITYHMPDKPMLPFPQIISLEQKYTHHVLDVHGVKSLQQFLLCSVIGLFAEFEAVA